jgi:hypothetical protein
LDASSFPAGMSLPEQDMASTADDIVTHGSLSHHNGVHEEREQPMLLALGQKGGAWQRRDGEGNARRGEARAQIPSAHHAKGHVEAWTGGKRPGARLQKEGAARRGSARWLDPTMAAAAELIRVLILFLPGGRGERVETT